MRIPAISLLVALVWFGTDARGADIDEVCLHIPTVETDNRTVNDAYRIAIGDLVGPVQSRF